MSFRKLGRCSIVGFNDTTDGPILKLSNLDTWFTPFSITPTFFRNNSVAKQSVMYCSRIHSQRFRKRQRNVLFNDAISCEDYTVYVVKEWNMILRNLSKYSDGEILSRTTRKTCPAAILSAIISTDPVGRGELFQAFHSRGLPQNDSLDFGGPPQSLHKYTNCTSKQLKTAPSKH
jgi:hypothetical protein